MYVMGQFQNIILNPVKGFSDMSVNKRALNTPYPLHKKKKKKTERKIEQREVRAFPKAKFCRFRYLSVKIA